MANDYDESNPASGMTPAQRAVMDAALQQRGIGKESDEDTLNQVNQALRANPEYQEYLRSLGVNTNVAAGQAWRLTDDQRKAAADWVNSKLGDLGKGMEIDPSGNINQNEGFGKQAKRWGPIVAAGIATALTAGGASPLLASAVGGGLGASTGALDGGGLKGALIGGALGAAPGVIGGLTKGAGAAGQAASSGLIPNSGSSLTAGLSGAAPGITSGAGAAGAWGGVSAAVKAASKYRDLLGAGADALGAGADQMAENRAAGLTTEIAREEIDRARQNDYRNYSVVREQDRRAGGNDAFRNVQRAEYLANAEGYTPKNGLKSYGFGPKAATETERAAAAQFLAEQQRRLQAGDSLLPVATDPGTYQFDPKLTKPGTTEKVLGYGGLFSQLASLLNK